MKGGKGSFQGGRGRLPPAHASPLGYGYASRLTLSAAPGSRCLGDGEGAGQTVPGE